jgi:hypothetical protein
MKKLPITIQSHTPELTNDYEINSTREIVEPIVKKYNSWLRFNWWENEGGEIHVESEDYNQVINFLKELFPEKEFLIIQKDEYELCVYSSIPGLEQKIEDVIYNGVKDIGVEIKGFSLIDFHNCDQWKKEDDDHWSTDFFEVKKS